ncbi:MAG TPA: 6-phosphofructokinase [Candidatus Limnocylindrales bacterium]|nr:6-phosphofructokinase [Candidatus Limnocylindrales bacterium]
MARTPRIGILTGGGDVPGLNSVIKSVVYRATEIGYEVYGIRRGWEGLTNMKPGPGLDENYIVPLDRNNTRAIDRTGGTWLHTSRTNARKMKAAKLPAHIGPDRLKQLETKDGEYNFTPIVLENIERLGLDYLIPIGGDDTLSFSQVLADNGVKLIAVPKTMDNDVQGTEYCIGFSTAISRAKDAINRQRTTLGSHERIGVFRIFGRDAGFTALYTAYVTSARCLIPEYKFNLDHLVELLVEDKLNNPSRYSLVIAAEGAMWEGGKIDEWGPPDSFGHKHKANIAEILASQIQSVSGEETLASELTYDLRSGDPDAVDSIVGITFANVAMNLVAEGVSGRMVAIRGGKYSHSPLPDPDQKPRSIDVASMYNTDRYRPIYTNRIGLPLLLGIPVPEDPTLGKAR